MHRPSRSRGLFALAGAAFLLAAAGAAGQERLFKRYCGRMPIFGLRSDYPNPGLVLPPPNSESDCADGIDDDADGPIDFADPDCLTGLGPQDLFLKLPFDVVQKVKDFTPARFTGGNRNGDPLGEILINSTGPGGRKLSYLRTADPNRYASVRVRVVVLPGKRGDRGGPVALRIQPAEAPAHAGKSYFVKCVPGLPVTIEKDLGDGTTQELARAESWASGEPIVIQEYNDASPTDSPCYQVVFSAVGSALRATLSEGICLGVVLGRFDVGNDRTVTLTATDGDLADGYVGLRSDSEGGEVLDDAQSALADPSVLDYIIEDPLEKSNPDAPRIAFFNSFSSGQDGLNYLTTPITSTDDRPYRRSMATVGDASLAAYLRAVGFHVDEYHIASFAAGVLTPDDINENYDLFWLPSSGASADTRSFVRGINIPFVFAEHVDGSSSFAGVWAGTGNLNGNENQRACPQSRFIASLNGASEAPDPVATNATGVGTFEYDGSTRELTYRVEFSGFTSAETAAHIHLGPVGEAGPPIVTLPAGSPKTGTATLTPAQETALLAGNLYVNVHSADHPGGEIRGQMGPRTLSYTKLRLIPPESGGDPDHPIVRGLADDKGDIPVHDAADIPLTAAYPTPGEGPAGLTGAGFKSALQILNERGWGPGASETQFAGWPVTEGAVVLASMVNPCNDQPLFQLSGGNLATEDQRGHIHLIAVEAGSPRMVADPENCTEPCEFGGRTVFYWISDPIFPYSTTKALSLLRRSALWALGFLESENRSDIPFKRGDTNGDGLFDISDAVFGLAWLFTGGEEPACIDAADSNDDERADVSDAVYSLGFLFLGGQEPGFPFSVCFGGCGLDFTPEPPAPGTVEDPASILSCKEYKPCRS